VGIAVMAPRLGLELFPLLRRASRGLPAATAGAFLDQLGIEDPDERSASRRRSFVAAAAGTVAGAIVAIGALLGIVVAWWV
jgi:hypothetical protein